MSYYVIKFKRILCMFVYMRLEIFFYMGVRFRHTWKTYFRVLATFMFFIYKNI